MNRQLLSAGSGSSGWQRLLVNNHTKQNTDAKNPACVSKYSSTLLIHMTQDISKVTVDPRLHVPFWDYITIGSNRNKNMPYYA